MVYILLLNILHNFVIFSISNTILWITLYIKNKPRIKKNNKKYFVGYGNLTFHKVWSINADNYFVFTRKACNEFISEL